jgi:hypothetical protein
MTFAVHGPSVSHSGRDNVPVAVARRSIGARYRRRCVASTQIISESWSALFSRGSISRERPDQRQPLGGALHWSQPLRGEHERDQLEWSRPLWSEFLTGGMGKTRVVRTVQTATRTRGRAAGTSDSTMSRTSPLSRAQLERFRFRGATPRVDWITLGGTCSAKGLSTWFHTGAVRPVVMMRGLFANRNARLSSPPKLTHRGHSGNMGLTGPDVRPLTIAAGECRRPECVVVSRQWVAWRLSL